MWIPEKISENNERQAAFTAVVVHADAYEVELSGTQGSGSGVQFLPYGIESVPPGGAAVVAVPSGRRLCVCGVQSQKRLGLEPGEVGLYSSGGASIVLKNDGRVLINGAEIR